MDSKIINFFLNNKSIIGYIIILLVLLNITNIFLEQDNNTTITKKEKTIKKNRISTFYLIFLLIIIIILFTNIPIIRQILLIINYSSLIYLLIIAPIFNNILTYNFLEKNTYISSILTVELSFIFARDKIAYLTSISNQTICQLVTISMIFAIVFLTIYIILINIRVIFYYLSIGSFNRINCILYIQILMIEDKYEENKFKKKLDSKKTKRAILIEATKYLTSFSIFYLIINTALINIRFFLKIFINRFNKISNSVLFAISKITFITTIFSLYFIIQISQYFNTIIISSYEFVASAIIIPLLLEGLLKKNNEK